MIFLQSQNDLSENVEVSTILGCFFLKAEKKNKVNNECHDPSYLNVNHYQ